MRVCYVPHCNTGYTSKVKRDNLAGKKSMFSAPKDKDLLQKWASVIPRSDRVLSCADSVCELHFHENDIIRFREIVMPDGTIYRGALRRNRLRDGAIPCIFPDLQSPLCSDEIKMELPEVEFDSFDDATAESSVTSSNARSSVASTSHDMATQTSTLEEDEANNRVAVSVFDQLRTQLPDITLPNSDWTASHVLGLSALVFVEWDDCFNVRKKVIVSKDASLLVLFKSIPVDVDRLEVHNIEDVKEILEYVGKLRICQALKQDRHSISCCGYILPREEVQAGKLEKHCEACSKTLRTSPTLVAERYIRLQGKFKAMQSKNRRLRLKVDRLLAEIITYKEKCAKVQTDVLE